MVYSQASMNVIAASMYSHSASSDQGAPIPPRILSAACLCFLALWVIESTKAWSACCSVRYEGLALGMQRSNGDTVLMESAEVLGGPMLSRHAGGKITPLPAWQPTPGGIGCCCCCWCVGASASAAGPGGGAWAPSTAPAPPVLVYSGEGVDWLLFASSELLE